MHGEQLVLVAVKLLLGLAPFVQQGLPAALDIFNIGLGLLGRLMSRGVRVVCALGFALGGVDAGVDVLHFLADGLEDLRRS